MTVEQLIEQLKKCRKDLTVYAFFDDCLFGLMDVDNGLGDRVDINLEPDYRTPLIDKQ